MEPSADYYRWNDWGHAKFTSAIMRKYKLIVKERFLWISLKLIQFKLLR
jgi:hypothetical protein